MTDKGARGAAPGRPDPALKSVEIYTDGACSGNPGPGGWAAILFYRGHKKEISGYEGDTTNNRMEIIAAIKGLECLKEPCSVTLYSDSAYLVNAYQKNWLERWERNGWRLTNGKQETKNADLWRHMSELCKRHHVSFNKVAGHSNNAINNRCDELAVAEIAARHKKRE